MSGALVSSRAGERTAGAALFGCGMLALANLPAHELPLEWLLAFTAPAAVLGLLQSRVRRQWQRGLLTTVLQLGSFALALQFAEPLSRPAALACTILPPLAFVIVRRRDADAALGLFLSFCVLLVGIILDGIAVPFIVGYGACACLALRSEAHLAACMASQSLRGPQRAPRGAPVLLWGLLLALPCAFGAFAIDRTLALLPSPSRVAEVAPTTTGAADTSRRKVGLDDSFRLDGGSGVLSDLHGEQLVFARTTDGSPVPTDLYLRSGFFAVAGLERWQIGTLELQGRPRTLDHVLRRPRPQTAVQGLEIERYDGARNFVFVPPHACKLHGVPDLQSDARREWLRQSEQSEQTDYAVSYQRLPPPQPDQPADPVGARLGLLTLPAGLDRAPFDALLREWDATGSPMRIAERIADGLARHCHYDRLEPSGPHAHALLNFLFAESDRHGYCMYFASAAALLLRLQGVPCRIGVGLYGGDQASAEPGARIYGSQHAHAWVEIPFADRGFMVFDPTPPAERGRAMPTTLVPAVEQPADEKPTEPGLSLLEGLVVFATQPWFLVTALLLAIAASMWPTGTARPAVRPSPPSARNARRLLVRILQALAEAGHRRGRGQTIELFTHELAARAQLAHELRAAFTAYQEVRFGGRTFDADHERTMLLGLQAAAQMPSLPPTTYPAGSATAGQT